MKDLETWVGRGSDPGAGAPEFGLMCQLKAGCVRRKWPGPDAGCLLEEAAKPPACLSLHHTLLPKLVPNPCLGQFPKLGNSSAREGRGGA